MADLCLQANSGKLIHKTRLKSPVNHSWDGTVFRKLSHYNQHQYMSHLQCGALFDQVTEKSTPHFTILCLSGAMAPRITGIGTRLSVTNVLISQ
jgi:hypothetical protein